MRAAALLLAVILGADAAAASLRYESSRLDLTLHDAVPILLSAGPDGNATVTAAGTGANATVVVGEGAPAVDDVVRALAQAAGTLRVRLELDAWEGAIASCASCDLELRWGSNVSSQLVLRGDQVSQAAGPWVDLEPGGNLSLFVVSEGTGAPSGQEARVRFALVSEAAGNPGVRVAYHALAVIFHV